MVNIADRHSQLSTVAKEIASSLAFAQERGGQQQIVTPLLYPGGARVVLRVEETPDGYFVSDYGAGKREAELMGDLRIYTRVAKEQADRHGVNFDSDMIFDLEVPRPALVTACIAVANASKSAVDETAEALSEQKAASQREKLWAILHSAYPQMRVNENGKFAGHSDLWTFDAVVHASRPILFQTVTAHANSANSAIVRFLDVRTLGPENTVRIAVPTTERPIPHESVLATTSRIIRLSQPIDTFARLAA